MPQSELTPLRYEFCTSARGALLDELHALALRNVEHIGPGYIAKRLETYNTVLLARTQDGKLAAFMCSNITEVATPIPFFRLPMLHFGLSVVDHPYRACGLARELPRTLVLELRRQFPVRFFLFGIVLTAKCSSPASFRTIQRATEPLFWPRLKTRNRRTSFEVPGWLTWATRNVRAALRLDIRDDLILAGVNSSGQFRLQPERYDQSKDPALFRYFEETVLPNHSEVLAFGLWHPVKLLRAVPTKRRIRA